MSFQTHLASTSRSQAVAMSLSPRHLFLQEWHMDDNVYPPHILPLTTHLTSCLCSPDTQTASKVHLHIWYCLHTHTHTHTHRVHTNNCPHPGPVCRHYRPPVHPSFAQRGFKHNLLSIGTAYSGTWSVKCTTKCKWLWTRLSGDLNWLLMTHKMIYFHLKRELLVLLVIYGHLKGV